MVKHVVMWKLKGIAEGYNPKVTATKMKEKLESMLGRIEGLMSLEVGLNQTENPDTYDICLISVHRNWQDLKNYQVHPVHKEVGAYVNEVRKTRAVVDFEY